MNDLDVRLREELDDLVRHEQSSPLLRERTLAKVRRRRRMQRVRRAVPVVAAAVAAVVVLVLTVRPSDTRDLDVSTDGAAGERICRIVYSNWPEDLGAVGAVVYSTGTDSAGSHPKSAVFNTIQADGVELPYITRIFIDATQGNPEPAPVGLRIDATDPNATDSFRTFESHGLTFGTPLWKEMLPGVLVGGQDVQLSVESVEGHWYVVATDPDSGNLAVEVEACSAP